MLKTINFLPTKIQYQKKTNKIRLWYRTKDNFQLSKKDLDFNYYCYVDTQFFEELPTLFFIVVVPNYIPKSIGGFPFSIPSLAFIVCRIFFN